jgi:hypothetical protein
MGRKDDKLILPERETPKAAASESPSRLRVIDKVLRPAEFAASGFSDAVINSVGAVPDLIGAGMRAARIPGAPEPGAYADAMRRYYNEAGEFISAPVNRALGYRDDQGQLTDVGGPAQPVGDIEKIARGAGEGAGLAASYMIPGTAMARAAKPGTTFANVGRAMSSQPVLQTVAGGVGGGVTEATDNPYAGMVAALTTGVGLPLVNRGITPFPSQLTANEKRLADAARAEGIPLTPGQQTGSEPLRTMESSFVELPFTGRMQQGIYDDQSKAFNEAVMRRAGVSADNASPQVIDDEFRAIGKEFDSLASQTTVNVDKAFFDDIATVENTYLRRLPTDVQPVVKSYVDDLYRMNGPPGSNPQIPGQQYQTITSDIKRTARSHAQRPDLKTALYALANAIDNALERSAGPALRGEWADARNRYRNLLTIAKAVSGGTNASRASADIPYGALTSTVRSSDKSGFARGRGDLNELSRVGDFIASATPANSGTPRRLNITNLLTLGSAGGGAGFLAGQTPEQAMIGMAAALGGPKLAQALYNTPYGQAYFRNQLSPRLSRPVETSVNVAAAQEPSLPSQLQNLNQLFAPEDSLQIEIRPPAGTR